MKRFFLALTLALLATPALAQATLTKLSVAYDGFSMTSGPMIYAEKEGIFKEFGLDTTPVFVAGGSALTQAVVGGSMDIAQNGYTPALSAAVQGADIVIIGGISNKLPFQLVVKDAITDAAQLKGQSIAISRFGSSTDTAAQLALDHLKLNRDDVKILQLGGEFEPARGGAERTDRRHDGAAARIGRAHPTRLSHPGRSHRSCGRISEHVVRHQPHVSESSSRRRQKVHDGNGDGRSRL